MKEPPDKKVKPIYKTIKTSLASVIKHENSVAKINTTVLMAHKIMIHTLYFLKLYLIDQYDQFQSFPVINRKLISNIMKIMCQAKGGGGRPPKDNTKSLKDNLTSFFNKNYKSIMKDTDLSYKHMNTILDYMAMDVLTLYETNIKQHYVEYVERYVNVMLDRDKIIADLKEEKDSKKNVEQFCRELRKVKNDILNIENDKLKSNNKYHQWINDNKNKLIPNKKFEKDNLYYDLQCHPQDYLSHMFFMMRSIEEKDPDLTIYNLFPLRNNIVPKHMRLDTTSLVHILLDKKYGKKGFYLTKGNLVRHQDRLWNFFFRTEMKCFYNKDSSKYRFNHMIETDGVSCSILLIRNDMYGKRYNIGKVKEKRELYMDDLEDFTHLKDKTLVSIDPNMGDLLYCANEETGDQFRYTQDQRRKETKAKKYRNIILDKKQETIIKGKTIIEWETELSTYNRKTIEFQKFREYLIKKNEINHMLMNFYKDKLYRKLKLNSYTNRQKSEAKMINNFIKTFGKPEDVVIGFGDWEQKKHRKYKEPVKGKGFRNLFRRWGFLVYLIYEWGTSSRCYNCQGGICETFRKCQNPKPYKTGTIIRHGLTKCKTCSGLWNRDVNSSLNIGRIMKTMISGKGRPEYLCPPKKRDIEVSISGATSVGMGTCHSLNKKSETTEPNFTRYEKTKPCLSLKWKGKN